MIVIRALAQHEAELASLVAAATPVAPTETIGRFEVPSAVRVHDDDQVQVSIRPSPRNLEVIDELAAENAAGNRSALVAAALNAFLPPPA